MRQVTTVRGRRSFLPSKSTISSTFRCEEVSSDWKWIPAGSFVPAVGDKLDVVGAVPGSATVCVTAIRFERIGADRQDFVEAY